MRPSHDSGPASQSCSCTSCMYKSESERPSIRRLIADGSRIDKLYYGKYIPLRERKLLSKLVRTRAVYDDIRNQLLSESDVTIKEKANLKPRKHQPARPKEMTATDKSSAILELVDMVDKGKVAGGKNLSDCCSCCICGSTLPHTHEHTSHMRRHRHAHGHAHGGAYTMSRTSMIRKKMGEVRRNVKFKAKSIKSAPCTCTSKFSGMIKRQSQDVIRRLKPEGSKSMFEQAVIESYDQDVGGRKKRMMQKTYQKIKKSKTRLMQSMGEGARKLRDSKTRLTENIEAEGKKSFEKIKQARRRVRENVKEAVRKSIRRKQPPTEELNLEEYYFPIKKDSIAKFKERLHRKKFTDYYACEPECIPDECVPEECFKIIKLRRARQKKAKKGEDNFSVEKNVGVTSNGSSVAVQAQQKGTVVTTETEKQKQVVQRKRPSAEQRISVDLGIKKTGIEPRVKVTKSRKVKMKSKETHSKEPPKEKQSVKSMTSLPPVSEAVNQQEAPKPKKGQQESSSVGIEIRKGKITASKAGTTTNRLHMKKRGRGQNVKLQSKVEKSSQTKLEHSIKEAQTGSHALKRCFCTLKLKGKGNRSKPTKSKSKNMSTATSSTTSTRKLDQMDKNVKEHVQTKRLKHHEMTKSTSKNMSTATSSTTSTRKLDQMDKNVKAHVQTKRLKHHEMECIECMSEECDPRDCIRHKKRRPVNAGVGAKPRHKSVSSLTSKSLSTGSLMTRKPKKDDKIGKRSSSSSRKLEQLEEHPSQRQVVRIGSTFSFSVEFYKDKPKEETLEPSHEKATEDRAKKHTQGTGKRKRLRHRHSQISTSTGKSKYTLTKHSLRRCFCTLKLAHADKKKTQTTTRSQGSATSQYTPDVTINVNKAVSTNKKYKLLPYECEPGVCVPGECDPYVCQKRINTRQMKHHAKQSNTDNRRTKSTSSFTSRSIPNRAKKVQSTSATYSSPSKKHKEKGKSMRRVRTTPSSPERQVVRIASSFSFNIEFYKDNHDKPSPESPSIDNGPKERPSKSSEITSKPKKDRGYQEKIKKRQKSTSMLVKKKNRGAFIGPAMKRCFCTLKLQKTKDKVTEHIEQASTGTRTPDNNVVDYKNILKSKGTKTKQEKQKFGYALEPYECEPNVCVPGECDPYECLKRIQMRQLKESGTLTERAKMKSATSVTHKSKFRSKGALAKSKYKPKKVSTISKNVEGDTEIEQKPQRQAVRIGSAFSFNIEFHKDMSPSTAIKEEVKDVKEFKAPKKIKHRGAEVRTASSSHQDTQVAAIKQAHKAAGIRPMLKRCFCTLKLQDKKDQKLKTNIKTPKVITVSRVTVTETKITDSKSLKILPSKKAHQGLNWAAAMYNINSSSTLSKSSIIFQYKEMKSYFHNQRSVNSISSKTLSEKVKSPCNMLVNSNFILPTRSANIDDKYACSENCILRRANNENHFLRKRNEILKYKKRYITTKKSGNRLEPYNNVGKLQQDLKVMGNNQIASPRYYAMNVQVQNKAGRPVQHKLKPYECEPGICVPDECDPYECEKLIRKRLMKRVDRMSGTNIRTKSMSSYASQSTSKSKAKKLQSRRAPREKVKKVAASGIKYESAPNRKHKQAVRVGSSFSFNIEFSKDKSSPVKYVPREEPKPSKAHKPTKPPKKVVKAKGTTGYGVSRHDRDSQSISSTEDKGSGMKPMMQRCFCTLKLQKRGKNQKVKTEKPVQHAFEKGTATPPNTLKDFVASRTMMNAGQNTANQKPYKLLPYECEPQVCIPGECDPYECLERIKQRNKKLKDSGTGAMQYKTSSSSNTGQRKSQARQIQSKPRRHQKSRESTATRSSNIVSYQGKPSRQAVRVGSSFSFNVEFFKENSQTPSPARVVQRESRPSVVTERAPKQKVPKKKVRVVGLQNEKKYKNRPSQMENVPNEVKSTMTTSFIKRCFCTAKLHGKRKEPKQEKIKPKITQSISVDSKASQANETKSFLKRCFCVLKLKKGEKNPDQNQPKPQHQRTKKRRHYWNRHFYSNIRLPKDELITTDKKVDTGPNKNRFRNLEPYECEPGICIPGECNPYECEKLIKARNVKLDTREAFTDRARTKSTSSSFKSSKTSKARRTQSNAPSTISRQGSTKTVKESPSHVESLRPSSNRQVVRIGSNFSFNIEFYKDRSPNTEEVQAAAKAIRQKPSRPEPKVKTIKTGKDDQFKEKGSDGTSVATYDRDSQANKAKMEDRASGIAPALKRCFCTLKLQKRNIPPPPPPAKYITQKTGTGAMKEVPTHQNRGVMTGKNLKLKPYECEPHVCIPYECDPYECEKLIKKRNLKETKAVITTNKEKPFGHKLLPYECEPNFCIPGQCDPYECEKRIKLRNMKHRTSGTSTKRYKGKSISSGIRSTSGSKAIKVQSPKSRDRRRSKSVSSKPFRSKKSVDSTKQSVKIGSGFSFDIEFYKNKSFSRPETQVRPVKQRVKHSKSISSSARRRLARTKDSQMQYRKNMRDTDSQSLAQKTQDTGVNPFLKRCFCTLKLQKSGEMVSKHAIGRAARDKNVYLATLLPYECEPGICVPGECDPYECEKRIRRRNMRSQMAGTERSSRDSSTSSASAKYRAAKNQAMREAQAQQRPKATYAKREYKEPRRPTLSSQSSSRQAVRIGSSFNFDVEFYKDHSGKFDERPRTYSRPVKPKKVEHIKTKPIKTQARSRSITSSEIRRRHNKMQTRPSRTESKSTGFGPLLKRCFCTLALNKHKTPPTSQTKATNRNDDLSDLYQYSRNVAVGTGKKYKLLPYECEPNVCIPGQCDPYECYERIKRRLKDSGTETPRPRKKYASSITSRQTKYKSANTQPLKERKRKERPSMTSTMRERIKKPTAPRYSTALGESSRQAVKIGSNFSFSVEFFKEHPNAVKIPKSVYKVKGLDEKPKKSYKVGKTSPSQKTFASKPSHVGRRGYDQKCQADCVKNATKGTTMGAFIKRCFCTLNLHKNPPRAVPKEKSKLSVIKKPRVPPQPKKPRVKVAPSPPPDTTRTSMAQTKEKYTANRTLPYKLKPYECEPNICVPGECDPYECLERIKRRNIRRRSRRTGTHIRSSQVSVSSMASRMVPRTARRVQSRERRTRKVSQPQQVPRVVEQPRFTHVFDSANRTGVKIGSNVSFNIEFYKDKTQVPITEQKIRYEDYRPKEPKLKRIPRRSTISESKPTGLHKGVGEKVCDRRTCEAQAGAMMKNKAAGVNNMLKRCFCTLKLQKNAMQPQKVITVNRVTIEENYRMRYMGAQEVVTNNQPNPLLLPFARNNETHSHLIRKRKSLHKRKIHGGNEKYCIHERNITNSFHESKEMKTLYPYTPTKFNKNVSTKNLIKNSYSYSQNPETVTVKAKRNGDLTKKACKLQSQTLEKTGKDFHKKSDGKMFLYKLFARIFSRRKSKQQQAEVKLVSSKPNGNLFKTDTLKYSKSDRRPTTTTVEKNAVPKKTTSLKVTRISGKRRANRDEINYHHRHTKFSHLQSGDTGHLYPTLNQHLRKRLPTKYENLSSSNLQKMINRNKLKIRSPYESDKIVQMAIINRKGNKAKSKMINTTTNTEIKKTRSKNVETCCGDPYTNNESLLNKVCNCFKPKVFNRKNTNITKNETLKYDADIGDTDNNKTIYIITSPDGKNINYNACPCTKKGKSVNGKNINTCPCSRNRKSLLSSGDNHLANLGGQQQGTAKTGKGKKQKDQNRKSLEIKHLDTCPCNGNRKSILSSGDNQLANQGGQQQDTAKTGKGKKQKDQKDQNRKSLDIKHLNTCPCNGNRKSILSSGDNHQANQGGQQQDTAKIAKGKKQKEQKKSGKNETIRKSRFLRLSRISTGRPVARDGKNETKITTNATDKCIYPAPCPCCKGTKTTRKSRLSTGEPVVQDEFSSGTDAPKQKNIKVKSGKNKTETTANATVKCHFPTPCPCCQGRKSAQDGTKGAKKMQGKDKKITGAKLTIKAKGEAKYEGKVHGMKSQAVKGKGKETKPCVCGSNVCAKEAKKMTVIAKKKKEIKSKPCICGSDVCAREAKKRATIAVEGKMSSKQKKEIKKKGKEKGKKDKDKEKIEKEKDKERGKLEKEKYRQAKKEKEAKIKAEAKAKMKAIQEKKRKKEQQVILKQFKKEDKKRAAERRKAAKKAQKEANLYLNSSDGLLAAEATLDVVKLAGTAAGDLGRCTSKAVLHPRITYGNLRALVKDPKRGLTAIKSAVLGSGVGDTVTRVQNRCCAMKCMRAVKNKMDENAATHYLMHIADEDPKKRLKFKKKRKMKRRREPIDFECSLFMASLRRRPCLAVYYTCPWFYPHCLSMLTLWKQFTDVMLFLIAVTVWSPCIVAMELCRACVCCFFCTG